MSALRRFADPMDQHELTSPSASGAPRSASPSAERIASALGDLVAATLGDDQPRASEILAAIGQRRIEIERRRATPIAVKVAIHRRDSWTCRYCRARTIAPPVLRFLSEVCPDEFPYHPNWRAGQVHPAYLLVSASLDHVDPGGRGGSWLDEDNLVTACWPCNTGKADLRLEEVGWAILSEADVRRDWDGLSSATNSLWERAGRPDIYRDWRRALSSIP
jgi:5-methylcytosine-specific restriction endonuclease McrA